MLLSNPQLKHLKAIAHNLKPVVMLGQKGLTENVVKETLVALKKHELIKIKVGIADREERQSTINTLCEQTASQCVQRIGHVAVLFKRNAQKPVIVFP